MVGEFFVAAVHRGIGRYLVDQSGGHQRAQQVNVVCVVPAQGQCQGEGGHGVAGGVDQVRVLPVPELRVDRISDCDLISCGGQ